MRKRKGILIVGLFCALIACFTLGFTMSIADAAPTLDGTTLRQAYPDRWVENVGLKFDYGNTIEIPAAKVKYNGVSKDAEIIVTYPNHHSFAKREVKLDVEGIYTVEYRAVFDDVIRSVTDSFRATKPLYSVSDEESSVKYIEAGAQGSYSCVNHKKDSTPVEEVMSGSVTGLYVNLAYGDTFRYNKLIDASKISTEETFIKIVVTPEIVGEEDWSDYYIYLTDAYDPSNYIEINLTNTQDGIEVPHSYLRAGTCGGKWAGWEYHPGKSHYSDPFGFPILHTFSGLVIAENSSNPGTYYRRITNIADNSLQFTLNYETREILATGPNSRWLGQDWLDPPINSKKNPIVIDLDDDSIFPKPWGGFTTGECYLTIVGGQYANQQVGHFVITELFGQDLSDMTMSDIPEAEITVDYGTYSETALPTAYVGFEYPIFDAEVISPYITGLEAIPRVFVNYGTPDKYEVTVLDGKFTPSSVGKYSIVYEAYDYYGNASRKVINVNAVEATGEMAFNFSEVPPTEVTSGTLINFPVPEITNCSGLVTPEIIFKNLATGEEVIVENFKYRPLVAGNYEIIYSATDYVKQHDSKSFNITVVATDKPIFLEEEFPAFPHYVLSGATYEFPILGAVDLEDGSRLTTTRSIIDKDGERQVTTDTVTPNVSANGTVTFRYTAQAKSGAIATKDFEIPAILAYSGKNINFIEYLQVTNKEVTIEREKNGLAVSTSQSGASVEFINPISASNVLVNFTMDSTLADVQSISIILTDSIDSSKQLKFTYTGSTKSFYINDKKGAIKREFTVPQNLIAGDTMNFAYYDSTATVMYDATSVAVIDILDYLSGDAFEGFTSDKVYMTFVFAVNPGKTIKMYLNSVGSQTFGGNGTKDYIPPEVGFKKSFDNSGSVGKTLTIPYIIVYDAIDPNPTAVMSVTDASGNPLTSVDGIRLDNVDCIKNKREYTILIPAVGSYTVWIKVTDFSGRTATPGFNITVLNEQPPVFTVDKKVEEEYKLGDYVITPKCTAYDYLGQACTVTCHFMTADRIINNFGTANTYYKVRLTKTGTYTIRYWAISKDNLVGYLDLVFKVVD